MKLPRLSDMLPPSPEDLYRNNTTQLIPLLAELPVLQKNAAMENAAAWRATLELYGPPPEPSTTPPEPPEDPEARAIELHLTPRSYLMPFAASAFTALVCIGAGVTVALYANDLTLHMPKVGVIGLGVLVPAMLMAQEWSKVADKVSKPHELRALADSAEISRRRSLVVGFVVLGSFALLRSFARYVPPGFQSLSVLGVEFAAVWCASASAALAAAHHTPGRHFGLARHFQNLATATQVRLARLGAANGGSTPPPPSPPPPPPPQASSSNSNSVDKAAQKENHNAPSKPRR